MTATDEPAFASKQRHHHRAPPTFDQPDAPPAGRRVIESIQVRAGRQCFDDAGDQPAGFPNLLKACRHPREHVAVASDASDGLEIRVKNASERRIRQVMLKRLTPGDESEGQRA